MKATPIIQSASSNAALLLQKHPLLAMLLICLLTTPLGFGAQEQFEVLQAVLVWAAGLLVCTLAGCRIFEKINQLALLLLAWTAACIWLAWGASPAQWWIVVCIPGGVLIWTYLHSAGKLTDGWRAFLLCAMGFCMRFAYVLATPYTVRQHDVKRFDSDSGHAAYIHYLYRNEQLPDFDVREVWQFYHPPLHHGIAAKWMQLLTSCGVSYSDAGECVQILTLAYSCLCMVLFLLLLQHFHLKGTALAIPLGIVAFHPTFFLLAGSINNDILSITFMVASILLTCKWYRNPRTSTILLLAVTIGCGMMTKLSAWMAAPAAATVFLIVLWRRRQNAKTLIVQYAVFGAVCIPLGLWWGIRNLIRFGVPITYVPMLSSDSAQYVGYIPFWQRLLDLDPKQWTYVYDCFTMYGQSYNEYNPTIGLLKTALFGELINSENFPAIAGFGELLFWAQVLVVLTSLAAMIAVCMGKRKKMDRTELLQLCLTYGITLISYYSFCIAYAHTCTQNMRYATPLIFIGCLFLGLWLQKEDERAASGVLQKAIVLPSLLFMGASFLVYACVCV